MEIMTELKAYAKVNLQLDVTGRREDGYHLLAGVMQRVSLHDDIILKVKDGTGTIDVRFDEPVPYKNTVRTAAERFLGEAPYDIDIGVKKHIPSEAGLGGASADAAAVLKGLNTAFAGTELERSRDELYALGLSVGADVPFCLMGGCAAAEGVGEILSPLPQMPMSFVIAKGQRGVSTPALFGLFDRMNGDVSSPRLPEGSLKNIINAIENGDIAKVAAEMKNALQPAAESIAPEIAALTNALLRYGALGACMTGSGAAVVGLFENTDSAAIAAERIMTGAEDIFCAVCEAME